MASNPFAQYKKGGNPFAVYKTPGTGPKAPTGFAAPGSAPAVAPIQGGPQDLKYIGDAEAARVAAAQSIQNRYEMQQIQAREAAQAALQARNNQLPASPNQKFDNISGLRRELEGQDAVKTYKNALPSYASALRSPDTPAGDQDMIYAFAKIMDPNSVVREGEANSVAALGTIGQQIAGGLRKQLDSSGKFTPELRAQLRNTLAGRVAEYDRAYNFERSRFRDLSEKQGIDPDLVVGRHIGDAYAAIENQYFRHDPNKSAAAARAEQANGGSAGHDPSNPYGPASQEGVPMGLATGKTREVPDPQANALLDGLLRSGASDQQINAALSAVGHEPVNPTQTAAARAYMAKHPDYKGGFGAATKTEQQGILNRVSASPVGTGIGAAVDGGLGGFTDEASGLIDKAIHGGNLSDLIAQANERKNLAYATHPTASTLGNIAGTGTAALGGGMLLRGAPLVAGLGRTAPFVGGGLYGGISGAGQNNDDRVGGFALGAAAGAAGTGLGQAVAVPIGALARTAPGVAATNGVRRMFGAGRITPTASLSPAEGSLFKATNKAGPDVVRSQLDQASNLGAPMSLADTTPQIRELAASAVRHSPTAAQVAENAFLPRARGQVDRLGAAVARDLGPVENVPQLSADLLAQAKAQAKPLFAKFEAEPPVRTPELDSILNTQFGHSGVAKAHYLADTERVDPKAMGFSMDENNKATLTPVSADLHANYATARSAYDEAQGALSSAQAKYAGGGNGGDVDAIKAQVQQRADDLAKAEEALKAQPTPGVAATTPGYTPRSLAFVKEGMDSVIEGKYRDVFGRLNLDKIGNAENGLKNDLLSELDRLYPNTYPQARGVYGGPMASRDALTLGRDAYNMDPNTLGVGLQGKTPEQFAQIQLGHRAQLMDQANKVRFNSNPFDATLNNPAAEMRLRTLYPDNQGGVANLLAARDMEGQLAKSTNDILGNSKTPQRLIADQAFTGPNFGDVAAAGVDIAHGGVPVGTVANGLKKAGMFAAKKRAVAKADDLAPMVFNTDPQAARSAIDDLIARAMARSQYVKQMRPTSVMGMLGGGLGASAAQGF